MTLFRNATHQDVWIEHHCERCAHNPGCPIVLKAITTGRKPKEWDRNTGKNLLMKDTIKCNAEVKQLPKPKPTKAFEDVPMFDLEPREVNYVPVEGLPTERRVSRATDHA